MKRHREEDLVEVKKELADCPEISLDCITEIAHLLTTNKEFSLKELKKIASLSEELHLFKKPARG